MRASASPPALDVPPVDIDVCGPLVRLHSNYDAGLVERLRALPQARFDRDHGEWLVPARRRALVALATLLLELGDRARLTDAARRRLERHGPGLIERRGGEFELSFAPRRLRLERVRELPDRSYEPRSRRWRVVPTRAGALGLLALIDAQEFIADHATAAELRRLAAPSKAARPSDDGDSEPSRRASPNPHWRHVTTGPVFERNPHRHEWVEGIGWCVRVRVDPSRRAQERRG